MSIFEYNNYKTFINDFIRLRPHKGRGQYLKLANFLNIHTTMISHIFKGDKDLTLEHAAKMCNYFGLNDLESEFFISLVHLSRAGNKELKKFYQKQIEALLERSKKISERLPTKKFLDEKDKALFYSSWFYSAIRILTSITEYQTKDELINNLNLPNKTVSQAIDFLLNTGLCKKEDGKITVGPIHTHLDQDSSLIYKHHSNWRLKAFERHEHLLPEELLFTSPLSISKNDIPVVREKIIKLIEEIRTVVDDTVPEELCCLNIDWFISDR